MTRETSGGGAYDGNYHVKEEVNDEEYKERIKIDDQRQFKMRNPIE